MYGVDVDSESVVDVYGVDGAGGQPCGGGDEEEKFVNIPIRYHLNYIKKWFIFVGMKSISLKVNEPVFQEMEKILENVQVSRNKYINEAIEYYNALQDRLLLEKQLLQESALISADSMAVLHEFEAIEDEW